MTGLASSGRRVLVAGVGNVLRCDDSFGPTVVQALERAGVPANVHLVELGIGGFNLVRELMDGYDALVIVDLVDRGGPPGRLYVLEPEVPDIASMTAAHRHALSDPHEAVPGRALTLARAAGVLPPIIRIVGCQPAETEVFSTQLTPTVEQVVPAAVETIRSILKNLNALDSHADRQPLFPS